jgi:acyl-CoA reductase-like NAD-dependent aldehyde dehydrogenase
VENGIGHKLSHLILQRFTAVFQKLETLDYTYSPCFIHDSADFKQAVKRILWGKLLNHGQACLSPDYILCSEEMELKFVEEATTIWKNIYGQGKEMQRSPHLGRIINPRHCLRLQSLLMNTDGRIVLGGCVDVEDLWVDPTIIGEYKGHKDTHIIKIEILFCVCEK